MSLPLPRVENVNPHHRPPYRLLMVGPGLTNVRSGRVLAARERRTTGRLSFLSRAPSLDTSRGLARLLGLRHTSTQFNSKRPRWGSGIAGRISGAREVIRNSQESVVDCIYFCDRTKEHTHLGFTHCIIAYVRGEV